MDFIILALLFFIALGCEKTPEKKKADATDRYAHRNVRSGKMSERQMINVAGGRRVRRVSKSA